MFFGSLESEKIIIGFLESEKIIIGFLESEKIIIGFLESEKIGTQESGKSDPYRSTPGA